MYLSQVYCIRRWICLHPKITQTEKINLTLTPVFYKKRLISTISMECDIFLSYALETFCSKSEIYSLFFSKFHDLLTQK